MNVDWLVVGAGFTGAVFAERMASAGKKVLVVDRRPHIGGNAYDEFDDRGILSHIYGPHIFHTNSDKVWAYLSSFTKWRFYEHQVLGSVEGRLLPIPFNLKSIRLSFPKQLAEKLGAGLIERFGYGQRIPILKLRAESGDLKMLADYVYTQVFEGYTIKQWGLRPEELAPSVTARVPIFVSEDCRYFQDKYQAIPKSGYTKLFQKMLFRSGLRVQLATSFQDVCAEVKAERIFYTGPIDELMGFEMGVLPYRSLRFEVESPQGAGFQPVGTINFPDSRPYTRTTEMPILTGQKSLFSALVTEYPMPHCPGQNEPFYPIPIEANQELYRCYREECMKKYPNMILAGRLGDYQYYNMDQACARGLMLAEQCA